MSDLTPSSAWLSDRPVLFFRTLNVDTDKNDTDATWRFTKVNKDRVPRTIADLKAQLLKDFASAPNQVKAVARTAWEESDESLVIGRVCDLLDALRDNFATFNAASKAWILAYRDKRGIKRKAEN